MVVITVTINKIFPNITYQLVLFGEMSTCEKDLQGPFYSYMLFILFSFQMGDFLFL